MRNINHHIKHHIDRLKDKPKVHQHAVALGIAIIFTLFVFVLWYFISLPKILRDYEINKSEVKRLDNNPLNKFKDNFIQNQNNDNNDDSVETINIDIE